MIVLMMTIMISVENIGRFYSSVEQRFSSSVEKKTLLGCALSQEDNEDTRDSSFFIQVVYTRLSSIVECVSMLF